MKERGKTPWENMRGENSTFIRNLNKSSRRLEREKRLESLMSQEMTGRSLLIRRELMGGWETLFWWAWRIGIGIDLGLIAMAIYSKHIGLI